MFLLASFNDSLPVCPSHFNKGYEEHLKSIIQDKYVDKVIPNVGLVIAFYDFIDIQDAKILPGDGRAHFKVEFQMIMFQPFLGEILQGSISGSDAIGLQVSLDFFQDIRIPSVLLRDPKGYDSTDQTWYWNYQGHKLPYTSNAVIRFRVTDVRFNKTQKTSDDTTTQEQSKAKEPPMVILGAVNEDGLGLRAWWE